MDTNCAVTEPEVEYVLNRYASAFYRKYRSSLHSMGADSDDVHQQIRLVYLSAQCQTDEPHLSKNILYARLVDWLRSELHSRAGSHRRVAFEEAMLDELGYEHEYDAPMLRKKLQDLMQHTDARTAFVVRKVLEHHTLKEIGTMIRVNESRVSQIMTKFVTFSRRALRVTAVIGVMIAWPYAQAFPADGEPGREPSISNLTAASGKSYVAHASGLQAGSVAYTDRAYTFTTVPANMKGAGYIQTAMEDKAATTPGFLRFEVNQPVTVYVAHDSRITTKPAWLSTFSDTGQDLALSGHGDPFRLYAQAFPAGTITLGGNAGSGRYSMYSVIIQPEGSGSSPGEDGSPATSTPPAGETVTESALEEPKSQGITACHSLAWDAPEQATDLRGYYIYVSKDGIELPKVEIPSTDTTISCEKLGLTEGSTYVVSATAFNSSGKESEHSNQLTLNWPIGESEPDLIAPARPNTLCFDVSIGETRMKICQEKGV